MLEGEMTMRSRSTALRFVMLAAAAAAFVACAPAVEEDVEEGSDALSGRVDAGPGPVVREGQEYKIAECFSGPAGAEERFATLSLVAKIGDEALITSLTSKKTDYRGQIAFDVEDIHIVDGTYYVGGTGSLTGNPRSGSIKLASFTLSTNESKVTISHETATPGGETHKNCVFTNLAIIHEQSSY